MSDVNRSLDKLKIDLSPLITPVVIPAGSSNDTTSNQDDQTPCSPQTMQDKSPINFENQSSPSSRNSNMSDRSHRSEDRHSDEVSQNSEEKEQEFPYEENQEASRGRLTSQSAMTIDSSQKSQSQKNHFGYRPHNIPCATPFVDDEYTPSAFNYPFVSCQTYVIMCPRKNKVLYSKGDSTVREMASLTKIMTSMVVFHLCNEYNVNMYKTWFRVSAEAANMIGTSACLKENQRLTVYDLLHGLMLPSGNDAAVCLAEGFSDIIARSPAQKQLQRKESKIQKKCSDTTSQKPTKSFSLFVKEMNLMAQRYHMKNTQYTNPHGLSDAANHSTAKDQAQLSSYAMRHQVFRKIVSCTQYNCDSYMSLVRIYERYGEDFEAPEDFEGKQLPFNSELGVRFCKFPMEWHNSNRLLTVKGFSGVKTGITNTAGACLSVYYDNGKSGDKRVTLITVVLGSRNIEYRWKDTRRLTLWAAECI